jgi:hypothetical protein
MLDDTSNQRGINFKLVCSERSGFRRTSTVNAAFSTASA